MGILKPAPEVDHPTYEIVGPVERFDMRVKAISRMYLKPGTVEYEQLYKAHPEFSKEYDAELHRLKAQAREYNFKNNPVNEQFVPALFVTMGLFGSMDTVTGTYNRMTHTTGRPKNLPDEKPINVDPVEMARKIKEFGKYLGAVKVRITKLNQDWVYSHYSGRIDPKLEGAPVDDMDYENVICIAVQHDLDMKKIGRGFAAEAEDGVRYSLAAWMCTVIAEFIRSNGYRARSIPCSNAPYLVIPTFVDAGMGEQGRHAFVVSKDIGCHWRPGAVATDMPLAIDKPVDFGLQDFCEKCKLCAEHCPAGAISFGGKEVVRGVRRWHIDIEKCARYDESQGHCCGICQAVCPWNHPKGSIFHDGIRELSQRFPFMNSAIIAADKLFYPYKRLKPPDWMSTPGYFGEK